MKWLVWVIALALLLIPFSASADYVPDEYHGYLKTLKFDGGGNILWINTSSLYYNEEWYCEIEIISSVVDDYGNITTLAVTCYNSSVIVLVDEDGHAINDESIQYEATALATERQGYIHVTGYEEGLYPNIVTEHIGQYPGWVSYYEIIGEAQANSIAVDEAGNVYTSGAANGDILLLQYNNLGELQWAVTYDFQSAYDEAVAVSIDSLGNIVVVGTSNHKIVTIKYDQLGNELWVVRYENKIETATSKVVSMAIDGEDHIIVIGTAIDQDQSKVVTLKYDPDGRLFWEAGFNGHIAEGHPYHLALDGADNIYVTGISPEEVPVAAKYNPEGNEQWTIEHENFSNPIDVNEQGFLFSAIAENDDYLFAIHNPEGNIVHEGGNYMGDCYELSVGGVTADNSGNFYISVFKSVFHPGYDDDSWWNDDDDDDDDGCGRW